MEAVADAFYLMLDSTQRPLHDHTNVSQLDEHGSEVLIKDGVLRIRDQEQ